MLEDHVVNFLTKRRFPLGFFGEQGGESIHHEFVDLASTFAHEFVDLASTFARVCPHTTPEENA